MRTHSLRSLKIFVRDECGVYVCVWGWAEGLLLVPSCSLIQTGPNSRHRDRQTISAYFFLCYGGYGDVIERPVQLV